MATSDAGVLAASLAAFPLMYCGRSSSARCSRWWPVAGFVAGAAAAGLGFAAGSETDISAVDWGVVAGPWVLVPAVIAIRALVPGERAEAPRLPPRDRAALRVARFRTEEAAHTFIRAIRPSATAPCEASAAQLAAVRASAEAEGISLLVEAPARDAASSAVDLTSCVPARVGDAFLVPFDLRGPEPSRPTWDGERVP